MPTRFHPAPAPLSADVLARWAAVPSTIIADVAKGAGMLDPALRPVRPFHGSGPMVGRAITALCAPGDFGAVLQATALAEAGDVLVIDAGGRNDAAMIGEIVCGALRRKGVRGVVVEGGLRDIGTIAQWSDFAAYARHIVANGPSSIEAGEVHATVKIGGAMIASGDLIVGDDDGLVAVPRGKIDELLPLALGKIELEKQWEEALASGRSPLDVFNLPPGMAI